MVWLGLLGEYDLGKLGGKGQQSQQEKYYYLSQIGNAVKEMHERSFILNFAVAQDDARDIYG